MKMSRKIKKVLRKGGIVAAIVGLCILLIPAKSTNAEESINADYDPALLVSPIATEFDRLPEANYLFANEVFDSNLNYYIHNARSDPLIDSSKVVITNQAVTGLSATDFTIHFKVSNPSRVRINKVGAIVSGARTSKYIYDSLTGLGLTTSTTLSSSFSMRKYGVTVNENETFWIQPVVEFADGSKKTGTKYSVKTPLSAQALESQFLFPLTKSQVWWPSTYAGHGEKSYLAAYSAVDIVLLNGKSCKGYDVYACQDGKVVQVDKSNGQVTILHTTTLRTTNGKVYTRWYSQCCHMTNITLKVNDTVKKGQIIGKVGNEGFSQGYHLHFQLMSGMNNSPWYANDKSKAISPYFVPGFVTATGGDFSYCKCDRSGPAVTAKLLNWAPTGQ